MTATSLSATSFVHATRINKSLTASAEKRILTWLAGRAPAWVTSDQLTILGLGSQIAAGVFFALARFDRRTLFAVVLCIFLNWLGDSLDGTLARVRNQQRPRYGFYVDHMVDVLGTTALMCGVSFSGFLHWQVGLAMLLAFLVLSCESYLATYTLHRFELSHGLFGPTELRILLIAGTFTLLRSPNAVVFGHRFLLFDIGGVIATAAMSTMALTITIRHTAQLFREEPLP